MKVLVAGASGFVGRRLCLALDQAGHDVAAMTRDPARYRGAGTPARGDVQEPASLEQAAAGCRAAYYLVHSLQAADFERRDAAGATRPAPSSARGTREREASTRRAQGRPAAGNRLPDGLAVSSGTCGAREPITPATFQFFTPGVISAQSASFTGK